MGEESIIYFLDSEQNPYILDDGEQVYIARSLPHLEVTDAEILTELNNVVQCLAMRSVSTNYYDISYGPADVNSSAYSVDIS